MKGLHPLGFFQDSAGDWSYGRMTSFVLAIGGIILALLGRDYGAVLASSFAFYGASKAQQAYSEGKALESTGKINPT